MATETVPLFNPNDGVTGRDGGPYLDIVQAEEAEKNRAKIEGREPDYDHLPAHAGIPLQTAGQQLFTVGVNSNPSQDNRNNENASVQFQAAVDSDEVLLTAFSERPKLEEEPAEPVFGVSDVNPAAIPTGPQAEENKTEKKAEPTKTAEPTHK